MEALRDALSDEDKPDTISARFSRVLVVPLFRISDRLRPSHHDR
jgi:hypothetical protein